MDDGRWMMNDGSESLGTSSETCLFSEQLTRISEL